VSTLHTPIPWRYQPGSSNIPGYVAGPTPEEYVAQLLSPFGILDERMYEGNGKLIVRAVNNHNELVLCLDRLVDDMVETHEDELTSDHNGDGPDGCSYCRNIASAKAALREAVK